MAARVGVILVGHGQTASHILDAAKGIVPPEVLDGVVAMDAGVGETEAFADRMCETIESVDQGRGVVVLVDLLGASPCQCARRSGTDRELVTVSGLNLAMLLKLSGLDRTSASPQEVAEACAEAGGRAIRVSAPVVKCVPPQEAAS